MDNVDYIYDKQDVDDLVNELIDENHENIIIFGMEYLPSKVLEEVDPIAYASVYSDMVDILLEEGTLTEDNAEYLGLL